MRHTLSTRILDTRSKLMRLVAWRLSYSLRTTQGDITVDQRKLLAQLVMHLRSPHALGSESLAWAACDNVITIVYANGSVAEFDVMVADASTVAWVVAHFDSTCWE